MERPMPVEAIASQESTGSELYSRDLLRLATGLPHGDRIDDAPYSAVCRSPVCGSEIAADVQLDGDGRVAALAFRARACAMGQASAALLRKAGIGQTPEEIIAARASLAELLADTEGAVLLWREHEVFAPARAHPGRHGAILLPYDAVLAALAATI
jgi:NifU-like protein involved in Fe-S cluster formation